MTEATLADTYSAQQMLSRLVGFNTESQLSNLPLIDFVDDYLSGHGLRAVRVPNADGDKHNLYVQIGPNVPGAVILSAHTDVVPVEGQPWTSDPYTLTERDGRLYGRGACDMKGFLAICLAAVPQMAAAELKRPIRLALSYDEEIGCIGAPVMIDHMNAHLPPAAAAIIGEPTMMKVVTGHKAVAELHIHVRGAEVHSSLMHTGVSAVMTAARLIEWLRQRGVENAAAALPDSPYDPPWTTLHVGRVEGGTAHNITARDCRFPIDIRTLPEDSTDAWIDRFTAFAHEVEAEIKAIRPEAFIDVHVESNVVGCRQEEDGAAEALARRLTGDNGTNVVAYGTEAGQFQDGGFSSVVCGPGSIEQAHQADEYLSLDQLAAGEDFMLRLIAEQSG